MENKVQTERKQYYQECHNVRHHGFCRWTVQEGDPKKGFRETYFSTVRGHYVIDDEKLINLENFTDLSYEKAKEILELPD